MKHSVSNRQLLGVFLLSQSLLMLEVVLTRVFSVLVFYHFAVLSISLALFGSAVGGIMVYLLPQVFRRERLGSMLTITSLAYAVSVLVSFMLLLGIPIHAHVSFAGFMNLTVVYLDLAFPFFFGGLTLALVVTHLSSNVSKVYFADLVGAASGCLLALAALEWLGGPGAVIAVAILGSLASLVFGWDARSRHTRWAAGVLGAVILLLLVNSQLDILRVVFVKGIPERRPTYERWNSFSRVVVFPEITYGAPFGWGLSSTRNYDNPGWMRVQIDGMAETPITRFDGDLETVSFLRYDVSNLVYYLRPQASTFIIGPGGGRDVLSALMFDAREVDGVELNPIIVDAVRGPFADYAGRVYEMPNVHIFVDDGRNFLARSSKQYDIIQASAVDTWAATSAGAFALSENTLYTIEAFRLFYQHLTDDGILAFSRFVYPTDRYGEALRLTSVGLAAWQEEGITEPSRNLIVVGSLLPAEDSGYISLLLKATPFTAEEIEQVEEICADMNFTVLFAPGGRGRGLVYEMVTAPDLERYWREYPIDITPPVDDRPFFFQMLRLTDIPRLGLAEVLRSEKLRIVPMATLGGALILVTVLAVAFVLGPMWWLKRTELDRHPMGTRWFLVYFALIGLGFMMVEIGLMQKFVLFLGHPTYSLAVVLLSVLLWSGIGAFATGQVATSAVPRVSRWTAITFIALVPFYVALMPRLQYGLMGERQWIKVLITIASLFPVGLLMGTFFPFGIRLLRERAEPLIPWCWAVNGAVSVFASVFSVAVGIQFGMRAELIGGWLAYVINTGVLLYLTRVSPGAALDR